ACRALEPHRRAQLLARTRRILNTNFPIIADWLDSHGGLFSYVPPDAGAIVYVRYNHAINSSDLVTRLREQKSVLIVPGDHCGMETIVVGVATRRHGRIASPRGVDVDSLIEKGPTAALKAPPSAASTKEFIAGIAAQTTAAAEGRLVVVETTTLDVKCGQPAI